MTPVLDEACAELALLVWPSVTSGFSSVAAIRWRIPPLGAMLHGKAKEKTRRNSSTLEWSVARLDGSCKCAWQLSRRYCGHNLIQKNDAGVLRSRNLTFSQGFSNLTALWNAC